MSRLESMKLSDTDMKRITGGAWEYDTITDKERAELDQIINAISESVVHPEATKWLDDFLDRMDAKYGPNPPLF